MWYSMCHRTLAYAASGVRLRLRRRLPNAYGARESQGVRGVLHEAGGTRRYYVLLRYIIYF